MKLGYFETNNDWENWLESNYDKETELWFVYYKKHANKPGVNYEDSVKIALCYGWIDSLIKKLDEDSFARKFNPRKENSVWSESNKQRIAELIEAGKMKPAGLKLVEAARQNGNWDKIITPPKIDLSVPEDFEKALKNHPEATTYFDTLTKPHKKEFLMWIKTAKRTETREKRINESIKMLLEKKQLGLK